MNMLWAGTALASVASAAPAPQSSPMTIPILVVDYLPVAGDKIDIAITGDWGASYAETKAKCDRQTAETIASLEQGSRYHAYKDPTSQPSLRYKVVGRIEIKEPTPTLRRQPGQGAPMTDYVSIMKRLDIRDWVERKGVKEIWIWGYDGGKLRLFESNMASPTGDISNSDRIADDLPVLSKTYTVYHYNYQRGTAEAVEDHMHQLEALLNCVDGRDKTPEDKWSELLFWGKFVGSDVSHKLVSTPKRCGWTHYAPNSEKDYDWANPRFVESDIEDWHPDAPGKTQLISSDRWAGNPLRWKIYWLQSIPGAANGLTYKGKALRNWWTFVADWDRARKEGWTLTMP